MRLALLSTVAALLGLGLAVPVAPADPDIAVVLKSLSRRCVALLAPASKLGIFYGPYRLLDPGPWTVRPSATLPLVAVANQDPEDRPLSPASPTSPPP